MTKWIPIEERLPDFDEDGVSNYVLVSFANATMVDIGRCERDEDGGATFYPGDDYESYKSYKLIVNAWMPLPEPYKGD
ncbi:MAG: DUF551 domain-containing protein [Lachnospiraceae bacterium]|nr:DUF551 domain-containing protein [Lachnospiraceae bacterium]